MWHKITFEKEGESYHVESSLVCEGEDRTYTAMAKTVGLPLAMACRLILENKIEARGCILPTTKEFYNPILDELKGQGVVFNEKIF